MTRVHCLAFGSNLYYNNAVANYSSSNTGTNTLYRGGTFVKGGAEYNSLAGGSRAVTGAALFSPKSAAPGTLALKLLVNTVDSDVTLSYSTNNGSTYGTPVQLIMATGGTGTVGSVSNLVASGFCSGTTVTPTSSPTWSTLPNGATCPRSRWLKITSGSLAGTMRVINDNTASTMTVVPPFPTKKLENATASGGVITCTVTAHGFANGSTVQISGSLGLSFNGAFVISVVDANTFTVVSAATGSYSTSTFGLAANVPASGDGYAIYTAEVVLTDAASETINVGIDLRLLPTTSQTDTGISFSQTDVLVSGTAPTNNPLIATVAASTDPTTYKLSGASSPGYHAGTAVGTPAADYFGATFASPPSIGFAEVITGGVRRAGLDGGMQGLNGGF